MKRESLRLIRPSGEGGCTASVNEAKVSGKREDIDKINSFKPFHFFDAQAFPMGPAMSDKDLHSCPGV